METPLDAKNEGGHLEQISNSGCEYYPTEAENGSSSTLFYIAVEYVKDDQTETEASCLTATQDAYMNFITSQVSPLDSNMSEANPYCPVSVEYEENTNNDLGPLIIHQYITQENSEQESLDHLTTAGALTDLSSEMPTDLSNADLETETQQYLELNEMIEGNNMDNNENEGVQLMPDSDQQEVELLITDHETGISYSVNAQQLLVDPHLLATITPNPMLEGSDFFPVEGANDIRYDLNSLTMISSANEESTIKNYVDSFASRNDAYLNAAKVHTRNSCGTNKVVEEEQLLSSVYTITDRPVLSRARASLPEAYLSIIKISGEDAVVAKKRVPKQTQFGPLKGVLNSYNKDDPKSETFFMLVEEDIYTVDVSDENYSNWMSFVRRAKTFEEQNLIITQEEDGLYFTSTKNILPKEELKVGNSVAYAQQFNLEVLKPIEKSWPCFECSEKFSSSEELQIHFNIHDELIENKKPRRKYKKASQGQQQVNVVECNMCLDLFNTGVSCTTLKKHLANKHQCAAVKTGKHFAIYQLYQCMICSIKFKMETLLKIHELEHDSELPLDLSNHICPQCQRKFPTRKQLVLHVSCHAVTKNITRGDNSVKCPVCHKLFTHPIRLQKHMLCHGSDENKRLQCSLCKNRFMTKSALLFHSKTHMDGEKHFECPICKEKFDHVLKLRLHVPHHAKDNVYTCPHCKKTFGKYCMVRKHIKRHSEKKHACSQCSQAFSMPENLRKHMLRHSDNREFLCADCGKQFKRKDKLGEHIKRMHLQVSVNRKHKPIRVKKTPIVTVKEPTDFHRFIYKCHNCLIGFKRRGMLVNHLVKRHPDIMPDSVPELNLPILQATREYFCQYCDKVYKSSNKRRLHTIKNHPGAALPPTRRDTRMGQAGVGSENFSTSGSVTTRPEKCQWCHRQYARKSKLTHHIRKAHPSKLIESESPRENCEKNNSLPPTNNTTVTNTTVASSVDSIPESFISSPVKHEETTFIVNHQTNEYQHVLQKCQTTTDGNITAITPAVMDGLIDEDSRYCHLSIDENEIIEGGQLDSHNAHLYHLLNTSNGIGC